MWAVRCFVNTCHDFGGAHGRHLSSLVGRAVGAALRFMANLPADVTSFGARARDSGLIKPAGPTVKKTGGCESHTVEHADGPTVRLGGNSNQRMGARVDSLVAAPGHICRTDSVRATRQPVAAHDARSAFAPPSKGRGAYPKLLGTLLATVAAVPVALAMRGFRGTSSSPKTMGRVLVLLAMLSTASGWKLPQREAPEMAMASTGLHGSTMDAITGEPHESPITGEVDGARDRRRLASGCNAGWCNAGWCACAPLPCFPPSCVTLPLPSCPQHVLQ